MKTRRFSNIVGNFSFRINQLKNFSVLKSVEYQLMRFRIFTGQPPKLKTEKVHKVSLFFFSIKCFKDIAWVVIAWITSTDEVFKSTTEKVLQLIFSTISSYLRDLGLPTFSYLGSHEFSFSLRPEMIKILVALSQKKAHNSDRWLSLYKPDVWQLDGLI